MGKIPGISITSMKLEEADYDALILPSFMDHTVYFLEKLDLITKGYIVQSASIANFKWEQEEVQLIPLPKEYGMKARVVVLAGLGPKKNYDMEKLRRATTLATRSILDKKYSSIGVLVSNELVINNDINYTCRETLLSVLMSTYKYSIGKKEEHLRRVAVITTENPDHGLEEYVRAVAEAIYISRDIANAPSNKINPEGFEKEVKKILSGLEHTSIRVFRQSELEKEGLNGILSVGKGGSEPRLILIEYHGDKSSNEWYGIVGKAVTFDAGGLDLKSRESMLDMKYDKSGGAVVVGVLYAIAKRKMRINIVAAIPVVENIPSKTSYKPRDVIRMYDGTLVEVIDTDAEGRLILADSIAYLVKNHKPRLIIDIATLTGSIVVALGNYAAGVFSNTEFYKNILLEASQETGERVWEMPLYPEYRDQLKSDIADLTNVGGRAGGACVAASFLKHFAKDTPWIHLDIAGVAWVQEHGPKAPYYPKGATGYGVRLLLSFFEKITRQRH